MNGDILLQYCGEVISHKEALAQEEKYGSDSSIGSYMFYYSYNNIKYCIDASEDDGRYGRLVNHSRRNDNCKMKLFIVDNQPQLYLVAKRDIDVGEELTYDYGDRCPKSIENFPWLLL